jgi:hypothetical protein
MAFMDFKNLQWLNEGSDADWKKALAESKLIAQGQQALKSSGYTPTETLITNPLTKGLESLNVDPRFARRTSENVANAAGWTPAGIPLSAAEGGDIFGRATANKDPLGMTGGVGLAAAGILTGKGSNTWDAVKAAKAEEMLAKGADPREVWSLLGTGRATWDNQLRQEISDDAAKFKYNPIYDFRYLPRNEYNKLGDFLDHPKLYAAHPELRETKVEFQPVPFKNKEGEKNFLGASYNNPLDRIRLDIYPPNYDHPNNIDPKDMQNILENVLHETNHAVQYKNNFGRGGASELFPATTKDKSFAKQLLQANELIAIRDKYNIPVNELASVRDRAKAAKPKLFSAGKTLKSSVDLSGKYTRDQIKEIYRDVVNQDVRKYKRLGGEAEARLVERRQPLTEQQRLETYPLQYLQGNRLTLDYPTNELFNRTTSGKIENFDLLNDSFWKN